MIKSTKVSLKVEDPKPSDYHTMREFAITSLPEKSILLLTNTEFDDLKFFQVAYKIRPDLVGIPMSEISNSKLDKRKFRQVSIPGSHLGDFDLDKFLTYNKNKEIFIHSAYPTKEITKHMGHPWGAMWYFPATPTKALEVSKLLAQKTASYPFKHNDKFENEFVQNYHNHFFVRIGAAAHHVTPKLDTVHKELIISGENQSMNQFMYMQYLTQTKKLSMLGTNV